MNPDFTKRLCLLLLSLLIIVGKASPQPVSNLEQSSFTPSKMTLEQSVAWLRTTLLSMGKQRIMMYSGPTSGDSYSEVTCTLVAFDSTVLTLAFTENYKMSGESWMQKLTFTLPLAAVDSQNIYIKVLEPEPGGMVPKGRHIVHIGMLKGQTSQTSQVLTEKGKTTTKILDNQEQTIYFPTKEKAQQTIEVLQRMVELVSARKNVK